MLEGGTSDGVPVEFEASAVDPFIRVGGADTSEADVCIGGHVEMNRAGAALLVAALPPIGHVRASAAEAPALHAILECLLDEVTENRIGATFAIHQHAQL